MPFSIRNITRKGHARRGNRRAGSVEARAAVCSMNAGWSLTAALLANPGLASAGVIPQESSMSHLVSGIVILLVLIAVTFSVAWIRRYLLTMLVVIAGGQFAIMMVLGGLPEDFPAWGPLVADPVLMMLFLTPLILRLRADSEGLLTEKNRVQVTLESIPEAVIGVDRQDRIDYINSSAEMMTGWSRGTALGKPLNEVLRLKSAPNPTPDQTSEGISTLLRKDGSSLQVELAISLSQRGRDPKNFGKVIAFRDITHSEQVRQNLLISNQHQRILNKLLQISSRNLSLDELLNTALDIILSTEWLATYPKGGIFLTEQDIQLSLKAHRNMDPALLSTCDLVPFGYCLCGKAALNRQLAFTPCLNTDHEIRTDGMEEHGHYHVPLLSGDIVIGLLMLYVEHGHQATEEEIGFLESVGKSLSTLIDQKRAEEKIQYLAYYDQLTDLSNRQRLNDHLEMAIARARRQRTGVAVMLLDLDRFKDVNDGLGHSRGDLLLIEVARRLKTCTRDSDVVARQGGDEFAIVMPDLSADPAVASGQATIMANRVRNALGETFTLDNHEFVLSSCMGVAFHPSDSNNAADMLKHANAALQHAKAGGRNSFQAYSADMNKNLAERLTMEKDLRLAIAQNQLTLFYQPRVDMSTGRVNGAEALIRWPHPERGMISPAKFIPLAEDTGLIIDIGAWVLRTACQQLMEWADQGHCRGLEMVSVNVSPVQFRQPNFCETVRSIVEETRIAPERLELELTEGMLMHNKESVLETLRELKDIGFHLAIDDFGTGYSSLSYLKRFPVDVLKIDQSFVRDIATDTDDAEIVRAIIAMARALRLKVIAEGVETEDQLEFLKAHRCESYQGYYFSRPIAPAEIESLVNRQAVAS